MSSETVSVSPVASFEKCSVVLLDVQGTTTSFNFFKETYFPYITKNAEEFLKANWEDKDVKAAVKDLSEKELDLEVATKTVLELTESGSDNKALKVLQGLITKKGYADNDLKAHVFDDVQEALESWAKSRKVAIYSTGDVNCQKQFFANTVKGDLSAHISNNFDQAVGEKTEADSYKKIAEQLEVKPDEVVFVTDIEDEGKAAKTAGLSVVLVAREGNAELSEEAKKNYPVVSSFGEISFEEKACKRKNTEEAEEPPTKVAKTDKDEKAELSPAKSEEKVEAEEPMEVDSSAKKTEEPKSEEKPSEKKEDTKPSEAEPKTEVKKPSEAEVKPESEGKKEEKKQSEAEQKKEEKKPSEAEPKKLPKAEQKTEEKMDTVDSTDKTEEKKETAAKPTVEETKKDETKSEEKSADNEVDSTSKPAENGTVKKKEETKEAKEETDSKVEEKASSTTEENEEKATEEKKDEKKPEEKVENGLENGDKNEEAKTNGDAAVAQNGDSEKASETNGDSKTEAETEKSEIKVKKVVPEPESSTEVSVEV